MSGSSMHSPSLKPKTSLPCVTAISSVNERTVSSTAFIRISVPIS